MAHHNFDAPGLQRYLKTSEEQDAATLEAEKRNLLAALGATGRYPEGRYGNRDEGEIRFAIAADATNGKVLVDFGKPVYSLGMTPEQAIELADSLVEKAWAARGITPPSES